MIRKTMAILLVLCLLLPILAGCGSGGADTGMTKLSLKPEKTLSLPYRGTPVYTAEDWIEGVYSTEKGIILRVAGRESQLDERYQPTGWKAVQVETVPDATYEGAKVNAMHMWVKVEKE